MADAQPMSSAPERTVASAPSIVHGGPRLEPESWVKPPFVLKPTVSLPGRTSRPFAPARIYDAARG